ncbi:MAG: tripartite tricarboxylate transporter substrate binding protein [Reyranella sp.]|nr:tripartite tricarboxylate transporter substrate binding protein [Reyranella sp.]
MLKIIGAVLAAVLLWPLGVQAQAYPSKPIRFVIPFGAGSATDALARIAGQELEQTLGQPIIIVPKPGADGALAAGEVKRAAPDGYTFMFGTNSPLAVVPNALKEPPYDVLTDFTPITYLGDNTFFLVVHPSVPANSVAELIAFAKASPKPMNYATGNTYAFVSMAMFARNNGIKLEAVRYKSEPDAMTDLLSGRVPLMNGTSTSTLPQVKAGKLRALSTSFPERSPLMPELPSLVEAGQRPFPIGPWFALVGPAGLPPEIVAAMNKAMVAALAKPSVVEAMQRHGFIPKSSTPEALAVYMKDQLGIWKTALKDAGIEPQ